MSCSIRYFESFVPFPSKRVFLLAAAGRRKDGLRRTWFDRLPLELVLGAVTAAVAGTVVLLDALFAAGWGLTLRLLLPALLGAACFALLLALLLTLSVRLKAGKWWRGTLLWLICHHLLRPVMRWLGRALRAVWRNLPLFWKSGLCWVGLSLFELLFLDSSYYFMLWIAEKLIFTPLLILLVLNLRRLQKGAAQLGAGDLRHQVSTANMLPTLREHAENLNSIGAGMQQAVSEQMRSERMKAELITNVSHDIKTPLTSIINYVDLLDKEGLTSESAAEYLEVLKRQSARLKKLTEDLVEASKASTGNLPVHLEPTDAGLLLSQAVGEYEERLAARQLEPIVRADEGMRILADGRLLWRVFDNLLGNICKYALTSTRVYLNAQREAGEVVVLFRNISNQALDFPAEELMERFVRGDTSRNTEGSGLGLSIARSLTELQGGSLSVEIDGDLFKVSLRFPVNGQSNG